MNQWVQQIYQWTLLHPAETVVFGLAGTAVTFLGIFWKPVWSFVSSCWAEISRSIRNELPEPRPHLRFVAISSQCFLPCHDKRPNAQIRTEWNVTNASRSGMPARLLRAELLKPRVRNSITSDIVFTVERLRDRHPNPTDYAIPLGKTGIASINLDFFLPPDKFNKPVKVKISVTDQLQNKHKLPEMMLQPIVGKPAK
jgi:hypothetical protein